MLKRKLHCEKGASLIEVLIALALLGIVIVPLLQGLSAAINSSDHARDRATMFSLAQSQIESIQKQTFSASGSYSIISPVPSGYTVEIVNVSVPVSYYYPATTPTPVPTVIQSITVRVSGDYGAVELVGYKVNH